ncbi:MAG: type II toxin-antitoxin system RelE/ParE family toxin [Alphaproteobacteria bacterium]|nr:type II toxin-antitoxin system RelE/ParE family toxin [Alphaproteobacteria bacterium]MDP6563582.1 type II toxin-antitoxin system RelE/ParE family toxin [Alphaproteobacteria bacterium]MDP6814269.1 type II toxin-antitoxin system RelE/ParE family toxin [Alphaproteobacteria bacterium]
MKRYLIRPAAERDLKDIGRYSRRTWGRAQADKYLRALHEKMQNLAGNPKLGVARDDIAEGYRSAHVGHHHVFYRAGDDTIMVVRVLHESMDVQRHFDIEKSPES